MPLVVSTEIGWRVKARVKPKVRRGSGEGQASRKPLDMSATHHHDGAGRPIQPYQALGRPREHRMRKMTTAISRLVLVAASLVPTAAVPAATSNQTAVTSPKAALGFSLGDDYLLANYTQLSGYWRTLDRESDRVTVVGYGTTSQGRPMLMAIVTSPDNQRNLARYNWLLRGKRACRSIARSSTASRSRTRWPRCTGGDPRGRVRSPSAVGCRRSLAGRPFSGHRRLPVGS